MATRRDAIKLMGAATATSVIPNLSCSHQDTGNHHQFRYCLNTSTIRGQDALEVAETGLRKMKNIVNSVIS